MRKVGERWYGQKTRHDLKREMVAVKWNGIEEAASYLRRKEEAIKDSILKCLKWKWLKNLFLEPKI